MKLEKWTGLLKKYRLAALVVLLGVVLMLLPTGGKAQTSGDGGETLWETFSLEETEKRMAEVLGAIDGVGRVRIMLTLRAGSTLRLAEDSSLSDSSRKSRCSPSTAAADGRRWWSPSSSIPPIRERWWSARGPAAAVCGWRW